MQNYYVYNIDFSDSTTKKLGDLTSCLELSLQDVYQAVSMYSKSIDIEVSKSMSKSFIFFAWKGMKYTRNNTI
mgnify:FL=1